MAFTKVRQALDDYIPDLNYELLYGIKRALNKFFPDEHFFQPAIEVSSDEDEVVFVPQVSPVTIDVSTPVNDDDDEEEELLTEMTPRTIFDPREEAKKLGLSNEKNYMDNYIRLEKSRKKELERNCIQKTAKKDKPKPPALASKKRRQTCYMERNPPPPPPGSPTTNQTKLKLRRYSVSALGIKDKKVQHERKLRKLPHRN